MLELDLMLVPFVEHEYQNLDAKQIEQLDSLLALNDIDLLEQLTKATGDNENHSEIVDFIRRSNTERRR